MCKHEEMYLQLCWLNITFQYRCDVHCQQQGYQYYGLHYGECHCFSSQPSSDWQRDNSNCDHDCPGDSNLKCGGCIMETCTYERLSYNNECYSVYRLNQYNYFMDEIDYPLTNSPTV